jgi:hypothetical protein
MAGAPEVQHLDAAGRVEMRIVAAGARQDMGQIDAALATLQSPELVSPSHRPWAARLKYAYADLLLADGREAEALEWFARAAEADAEGQTDAAARLAELDGDDSAGSRHEADEVVFIDVLDLDAPEDARDGTVESG